MPIVSISGFQCCRCEYVWRPRHGTDSKDKTKVCPHCKSPYWDVPRRRQKREVQKDTTKSQSSEKTVKGGNKSHE